MCINICKSEKRVVVFWVNWCQNMLIWQRITCKGTHQDIVQDCNPDKPHRVQLPAYCFWEVWKAHNFHQNFEWQPLCPSLIAWYFLKIEINYFTNYVIILLSDTPTIPLLGGDVWPRFILSLNCKAD